MPFNSNSWRYLLRISGEKQVTAIFSKLLSEEPHVHGHVAAVLTYLRDRPAATRPA
jgi:hypothetical protein